MTLHTLLAMFLAIRMNVSAWSATVGSFISGCAFNLHQGTARCN